MTGPKLDWSANIALGASHLRRIIEHVTADFDACRDCRLRRPPTGGDIMVASLNRPFSSYHGFAAFGPAWV